MTLLVFLIGRQITRPHAANKESAITLKQGRQDRADGEVDVEEVQVKSVILFGVCNRTILASSPGSQLLIYEYIGACLLARYVVRSLPQFSDVSLHLTDSPTS